MSPPPLRSDDDAWAQRAKAAQWAAEELDACKQAVGRILSNNYFGEGCTEAPPVFQELAASLSIGPTSWRASLVSHATEMARLASLCSTGSASIDDQDSVGARPLGN